LKSKFKVGRITNDWEPRMSGISAFVRNYFKEGAFVLRLPDRSEIDIGGATGQASPLIVSLSTWKAARAILRDPHLAVGEAYMDGDLTIERGSIYDFLSIAVRNFRRHHKFRPWTLLDDARAKLIDAHNRFAARRNVAHHYDLSIDLYRRFLDADLQYSCAYFTRPDLTLEEAQLAKKRLIAEKLLLQPGAQVLDIGSGWGGMALTLAEEFGAEVTGVTLSKEQLSVARQRANQRGLSEKAHFELTDYRDVQAQFDRVVSVGMLEHVGEGNYGAYFAAVARLLKPDGIALIHTIAKADGPAPTSGWTRKYIFPGGYIPALSQLAPAIERAGLFVSDMEVLRIHYAETLYAWRQRFERHRSEIAALYDERFCRMWEFYLAGSEASFRFGHSVVMQFQLTRQIDTAPITREYLYRAQHAGSRHFEPTR
jgi:cyclopropane-fatty-acyl-phospholipid synthase